MDPLNADKLAFTSRWVPVQSSVKAYLRSLVRDAQHAEDLLQEVALRAHENYEQYDPTRPFIGWVLGIARYQILAYYKRRNADRHVFSEKLLASIEEQYVELQPTMNARSDALERCLEKLPARLARIMTARYRDGLQAPQIATHMGATATAINTALTRARKQLKQCVEARLRAEEAGRG